MIFCNILCAATLNLSMFVFPYDFLSFTFVIFISLKLNYFMFNLLDFKVFFLISFAIFQYQYSWAIKKKNFDIDLNI